MLNDGIIHDGCSNLRKSSKVWCSPSENVQLSSSPTVKSPPPPLPSLWPSLSRSPPSLTPSRLLPQLLLLLLLLVAAATSYNNTLTLPPYPPPPPSLFLSPLLLPLPFSLIFLRCWSLKTWLQGTFHQLFMKYSSFLRNLSPSFFLTIYSLTCPIYVYMYIKVIIYIVNSIQSYCNKLLIMLVVSAFILYRKRFRFISDKHSKTIVGERLSCW